MGYPYGKYQKRYQHRQRIEAIAEQTQSAELPDQRNQRATHRQQGETQRMAVPEHRSRCQQQGQQTELENRRSAHGNVSDLLGEADDLDLEIHVLELTANLLLQDLVVSHIVQALAVSIELVEVDRDHRAALVTSHQRSDKTTLRRRVGDHGYARLIETFRRYRPWYQRVGTEALFGDFIDEGVGRPQRTHAAARHVGQKDQRLGDVIQTLEPCLAPDRPLASLDHHRQPIRAEQVIAIGLKGLDVFMADGQLLFKPGFHAQLHGKPSHAQGE